MNSYQAYNVGHMVADRVASAMHEIRQAEKDVALYCNGMAFDGKSAEDIYRQALVDGFGVPERELRHLDAATLRVILKHQAKPGAAQRFEPAMAHDSNAASPLDSILKGIKPPRDLSNRNDYRRCL